MSPANFDLYIIYIFIYYYNEYDGVDINRDDGGVGDKSVMTVMM